MLEKIYLLKFTSIQGVKELVFKLQNTNHEILVNILLHKSQKKINFKNIITSK